MTGHSLTNTGITEGSTPATRISMPPVVDWHMILDRELDQLTRPEMGVIGSLGFVALGAVFGLIAPLFGALEKVGAEPPNIMGKGDIAAIAAFFGCLGLTVICLLI